MSSVKKNYLYNSLYQIMIMIIPLITTPYVSRVLGTNGVGMYSYSYSIAYYFMMFSMLGLNNYGNRAIATVRDNKEECSKNFTSIYCMQCITSFLVLLLYVIYVLLLCEDKVMGLIMAIFVFSSVFDINWFYFGLEQFKLTVVRNAVVKIITVICIFLFVKDKNDVYIYALIYALGTLLSHLYLWTQLHKRVKFVHICLNDITKHLKPNLILFIPVVAVSLYKYMDKIMLGMMANKIEVGIYESCEKIMNIPLGLIVSLGTVMLPRITNLIANDDNNTAKTYLYNSFLFAMFLASSMSFGIMGVSKEFVPLFFGNGFDECISVFQVLLPSCIFVAFANVIRTQYLIPKKKDNIYILSVVLGATVNLFVNLLLISKYKAVGAAIGTLCAEMTVCIAQCISVKKEIDFKYLLKITSPCIISGFIMYFVLYYIMNFEKSFIFLCIKIFAGIAIFFLTMIHFLHHNSAIGTIFRSFINQKNTFNKNT